MEFKDAIEPMVTHGKKIALPFFHGYWEWNEAYEDILMHCKGGEVIPLTQTKDVLFTIKNICDDRWEVVEEEE